MGKGLIVAESTSPVGRGTAGLLLINGIPSPFSGSSDGLVAGKTVLGAGLGANSDSRGWNGQEKAGDDDTTPPETGAGAATADSHGAVAEFSGAGGSEDTFMVSFWPC